MKAGHWLLTPSPMVGFFESLIRAIIGKGPFRAHSVDSAGILMHLQVSMSNIPSAK